MASAPLTASSTSCWPRRQTATALSAAASTALAAASLA
eukprot:CAMPEP_0179118180 /NCGR_PEP_ID=MMETSP0796-20121207/55557_1 /TAXON_ID=73915 /ORGANISM="Pyrodinium bahamense, Strain pbaha01" /LENGTH=37 /DNA_ID= /DNA_START= /DNA_END= /DNA_ORIENTATION=